MTPRLLVVLVLMLALPLALVVWAFRRPRPQAVPVALALLAYQWVFYAYAREVLAGIGHLGLLPLYGVPLPLGSLLGSLAQACHAQRPGAYLAWVGLAVTGLAGLGQLPQPGCRLGGWPRPGRGQPPPC